MIRMLIHALRVGASIDNPIPLKWVGAACAVAILALNVAKGYGVLVDVPETDVTELVIAAVVLYSQLATTEKIGVFPADRRVHDAVHDRLHPESVPTGSDAPEARNRGGLPHGPFFDS